MISTWELPFNHCTAESIVDRQFRFDYDPRWETGSWEMRADPRHITTLC